MICNEYVLYTVYTAEFALCTELSTVSAGAEREEGWRARAWGEVCAVSRQAEAHSDGLRAPGSSSTCASTCRSPASGVKKRYKSPLVASCVRRVGAPQSFCHTCAQPVRLRILPRVHELRTADQNQCSQRSPVEGESSVVRREAGQRLPLHRRTSILRRSVALVPRSSPNESIETTGEYAKNYQ